MMNRGRWGKGTWLVLGLGGLLSFPIAHRMNEAKAAAAPSTAVTPKAEAPHEARALSRAFASVSKAIVPSVVRIDVEMTQQGPRRAPGQEDEQHIPPFFRHFFDFDGQMPMPGPQRGVGSGFILDSQGDIVTNRHVVQGATKVTVTFSDGQEFPAKVVGKDAQTDVAVVRLEKLPSSMVVSRLGDSDQLEVGEWVIAVGSPLGLDQTVTAGIVSGKGKTRGRMQMSGKRVRRYIQTDAKINPGNSGGPLCNLDGEVVGVNTLIQVGDGGSYGFSIPINEVKRVAQLLIKDGRVRYPFLGVMLTDVKSLDDDKRAKLGANAPKSGALVTDLTPGAPAGAAGLRPGDIVTTIGGQKVQDAADVVDYVSSQSIGAKVALGYVRDGKSATATAELGELPDEDAKSEQTPRLGMALQSLTPDLADSLGIDRRTNGAAVTDVVAGSPAEQAGIHPGDVILEVNRRPVTSAQDAVTALSNPAAHGSFLLRVRYAGGTRFVTLKL